MRKLVLTLLAAAALAVPTVVVESTVNAPPAAAHDSSSAHVCNYVYNVGLYITPAENVYALDANVCMGKWNEITPDLWTVEGMVRYHCFRNGQPWDGCRANGQVEFHWSPDGAFQWTVDESDSFTRPNVSWPCSVGQNCYFQDSGRISSTHDLDDTQDMTRAKQEGGQVRFLLADGTTVLRAISNTYTAEWYAAN